MQKKRFIKSAHNICYKKLVKFIMMNENKMIKKYKNPNPNGRPLVDCPNCGKRVENHAKGMCFNCYRTYAWQKKKIVCKSCGRERENRGYGLCGGCFTRLHHYNKVKAYNAKKTSGLELEKFKMITTKCASCGFNKIVDLHHLDGDKRNTDDKNLIGLCPNCHKMIHSYDYYEEIKDRLARKGFDVSKIHPSNYVYRKDEKKSEKDGI